MALLLLLILLCVHQSLAMKGRDRSPRHDHPIIPRNRNISTSSTSSSSTATILQNQQYSAYASASGPRFLDPPDDSKCDQGSTCSLRSSIFSRSVNTKLVPPSESNTAAIPASTNSMSISSWSTISSHVSQSVFPVSSALSHKTTGSLQKTSAGQDVTAEPNFHNSRTVLVKETSIVSSSHLAPTTQTTSISSTGYGITGEFPVSLTGPHTIHLASVHLTAFKIGYKSSKITGVLVPESQGNRPTSTSEPASQKTYDPMGESGVNQEEGKSDDDSNNANPNNDQVTGSLLSILGNTLTPGGPALTITPIPAADAASKGDTVAPPIPAPIPTPLVLSLDTSNNLIYKYLLLQQTAYSQQKSDDGAAPAGPPGNGQSQDSHPKTEPSNEHAGVASPIRTSLPALFNEPIVILPNGEGVSIAGTTLFPSATPGSTDSQTGKSNVIVISGTTASLLGTSTILVVGAGKTNTYILPMPPPTPAPKTASHSNNPTSNPNPNLNVPASNDNTATTNLPNLPNHPIALLPNGEISIAGTTLYPTASAILNSDINYKPQEEESDEIIISPGTTVSLLGTSAIVIMADGKTSTMLWTGAGGKGMATAISSGELGRTAAAAVQTQTSASSSTNSTAAASLASSASPMRNANDSPASSSSSPSSSSPSSSAAERLRILREKASSIYIAMAFATTFYSSILLFLLWS